MNSEEHDDLWRLMGRAKQPQPSPFFARNIVREVRQLKQDRPGVLGWLRDLHTYFRVQAIATYAALIIAAVLFFKQQPRENLAEERQLLALAQTVTESPDYHVIGHLDELLDSDENAVWLDTY